MNEYTACELAYKNGYDKGYEDGASMNKKADGAEMIEEIIRKIELDEELTEEEKQIVHDIIVPIIDAFPGVIEMMKTAVSEANKKVRVLAEKIKNL